MPAGKGTYGKKVGRPAKKKAAKKAAKKKVVKKKEPKKFTGYGMSALHSGLMPEQPYPKSKPKKKVAKKPETAAAKAERKRISRQNALPHKTMTERLNDNGGIIGKILTPRLTATEWMLSKTNPKKKKKKKKAKKK